MDVIKVMESTGCDSGSCRRVIDAKELPGILWQVFHPSDADKIRDLLSKILAQEKLSKKRDKSRSRQKLSENDRKKRENNKRKNVKKNWNSYAKESVKNGKENLHCSNKRNLKNGNLRHYKKKEN